MQFIERIKRKAVYCVMRMVSYGSTVCIYALHGDVHQYRAEQPT